MKCWMLYSLALALTVLTPPRAVRGKGPSPDGVAQDAPSSVDTPSGSATPATRSSSAAVIITVDGQVDEYSRDAMFRRFTKARAAGAGTVILQIDTYGGLVTAGLDMSRFLKQQEDLHVIAFVNDKAISAGAMIALACDEIVMSPSATIGDSAPIALAPGGGMHEMAPAERAKAESPILADFYDSAVRNGYDPMLAEAMVSVGRVVYWVQHEDGRRRFVNEPDYAKLSAEGWQPVKGAPSPVDRGDSLLTVHTDVAIQLGLAKGRAVSAAALAAERGLKVVANLTPGRGERLVGVLGGTALRAVLLTVFLISLYIALHIPGHGGAEAVALISLGLLVGVPLLTGYAQWWEILAVLIGLCLVALEIFVIPGFGVTGVTGIALIFGGLILTFVGNVPGLPGLWRLPAMRDGVQSGLSVVVAAFLISIVTSLWLRRYLPKLPYFNRLILTTTTGTPAVAGPAGLAADGAADAWPFAGTIGRAVTDLKPGGSAEFPYADDRRVAAVVCDSGYVSAGSKLTVREVRGNRIVVRPV